jgi:hypothetical protein
MNATSRRRLLRPNGTLCLLACVALLAACHRPVIDSASSLLALRLDPACTIPVPAVPLSAGRRDSLPLDDRKGDPHYRFAQWARDLPNGFGGTYLTSSDGGHVVLLLQDTVVTPDVLRALSQRLTGYYRRAFDESSFQLRPVRWNYAQLYEWYRYLQPRVFGLGAHATGIDVLQNRLHFKVATERDLRTLVRELQQLGVPCGLVELDVGSIAQLTHGGPHGVR